MKKRHIIIGVLLTIVSVGGATAALVFAVEMGTPQLAATTQQTATNSTSLPVPPVPSSNVETSSVPATVPETPSTYTPTPSRRVSNLTEPSRGESSAAPVAQGSVYESTNWSGYVATNATYTGVSGSWTVPSPTATSTYGDSTDAAWVGLGGVSSSDLLQIGTDDVVSPSGAITIEAFYEFLPEAATYISTLTVNPGDQVSANINETSTDVWALSLTDTTTGQTFNTTVDYDSSLSSADWVEEVPSYTNGSLTTLDDFGTVSFTGASAIMNGATTTLSNTTPSSITMLSSTSGQPIAVPSSNDNDSFTVTYQP